jgi:HD-GYP domain-containing protein (c-di-GMP phosphodiesterase class II)
MLLAEQLVGEARARRPKQMTARERIVVGASAACFLLAAVSAAVFLPSHREADPLLAGLLVAAYAAVSRVRFEFGSTYVTPEQLVFAPMVLLLPLPWVPLLVAGAALVAMIPDFINGSWHRERALSPLSDSWFSLGPVVVLAAFAAGDPRLADAEIYAVAFGAQIVMDFGWATVRDRVVDRLPYKAIWESYAGIARFDAILSPIAFMITLAARTHPLALLALGPLVWLLDIFSRERQGRYKATLELHRAYRGTVMLLSDVVEFDDTYTAEHSRSIVDLVHAVSDELGIDANARQELEFAALLHDIGKIAIPKEVLNKPAKLTDEEYELMKTHTIEGQFMLDRVGGLLGRVGEVVRSCHERWDGGGYPDGLSGTEIPLAARIVFTCDAWNAMTTDRVYRAALPKEEAIRELLANAGTQFDPTVVVALTKVVEEGEPVLAPVDEVRAVLAAAPVTDGVRAAT